MLSYSKRLLFLILILSSTISFSQSKKALQEKKAKIEKDIKYTNKLLQKTKNNKEKSLSYLKTLNRQVENREELLQMLNTEIGLIEKQIQKIKILILQKQELIKDKKEEVKSIEEDYAKMIYYASKNQMVYDSWVFIFSSESFSQAYKRIKYLKQYTQHRKNQVQIISKSKQELTNEIVNLDNHKRNLATEKGNKKNLIFNKKTEIEQLEIEKKDKEGIINKLKKSEKHFIKELQKQENTAKELDKRIRKIIEEEIRKVREKENKQKNKGLALTPEAKQLSANFLENKGSLPWPLAKGVIVQEFGKQKHAIFKNIETHNNGIDIATEKNASVRTVFNGKVSRIFLIKGEGKVVLINHGEYFSVYSGLKEVIVQTNENVYAKQKIGLVITEKVKNRTELHFEIWKGYNKQNPSDWLFKAN